MKPFFSIIVPTYNRAHLISKAIESVIAQSFVNWELIIVDDGSTDKTMDLIASYQEKDTRIRYIYQENAERSAARNNGIDHAKGEYICFLDSDDYYLKKNLNTFITQPSRMTTMDAWRKDRKECEIKRMCLNLLYKPSLAHHK